MALLPKPALRRSVATAPIRASFFDDDDDVRSSPEGTRIRATMLSAYRNLPFTGPAFALPGGKVVCEDMWEAALEVALDATADLGIDALREFSLERWLGQKVRDEGSAAQRQQYDELLSSFDLPPEPVDNSFRSGLPEDIYKDVVHQPLQEIEVYRGLDDLVCEEMPGKPSLQPDQDDEDEGGDDAAEADAPGKRASHWA